MDQTKKLILATCAGVLALGGGIYGVSSVFSSNDDTSLEMDGRSETFQPVSPSIAPVKDAPPSEPITETIPSEPMSPPIRAQPMKDAPDSDDGQDTAPALEFSPTGRISASPEQLKIMQESHGPYLPPALPGGINAAQPPTQREEDEELYKPLPGQAAAPAAQEQRAPEAAPVTQESATPTTGTTPAETTGSVVGTGGTNDKDAAAAKVSPPISPPIVNGSITRMGSAPTYDALSGQQINSSAVQPRAFDAITGAQIGGDPNTKSYKAPAFDAVTGVQVNAQQNAANGYPIVAPVKYDAITGKEIGTEASGNQAPKPDKPQSLRDEMRSRMKSDFDKK